MEDIFSLFEETEHDDLNSSIAYLSVERLILPLPSGT
jgi:hypothetical protein